MNSQKRHPIKLVASRTGLTQHAIRAWERRYGAVQPGRTPKNRRLYSDDDIARLRLLARVTTEGRSIGQVALLPTDDLLKLVEEYAAVPELAVASPAQVLDAALQAIEQFDGKRIEDILTRSEVSWSQIRVIDELVRPLIDEIGERWRTGAFRVAHEHLASSVIRGFLTNLRTTKHPPEHGPVAVFATPAGQWHELGALMAAAVAGIDGWRVAYLGANLPAEDIVATARAVNARVVALSIVYPTDDPMLSHELLKLRKILGPHKAILAGGRAAGAYAPVLAEIGAIHISDLSLLRSELERTRLPRGIASSTTTLD
jgi:methanogenic corrinoid protein MtbC1